MGSVDSVPLVSQTKSGVQYLAGDKEGAIETQSNFVRTCPLVSQGKSAYNWYKGDKEEAWETQKKFMGNMSNLVDGIPVVGHLKGGIHYACGDRDGGDNAMKAASRTVGVIGGGAVGGLLGGPAGAVAGGIAGGLAVDGTTTVVDSRVHDEERPAGQIAAMKNILNGNSSAGEIFDCCAGLVFDGALGYVSGDAAVKLRNTRNNQTLYRVAGETEVEQSVKAGRLVKQTGTKGEVWLTESPDHSMTYSKTRPVKSGILEVEVPRNTYEPTKAGAIKQQGSKAVQASRIAEGQGRANLLNTERLGKNPQGKVNFGIKGKANLQTFNNNIKAIRRIQPESLKIHSLSRRYGRSGTGAILRVKDHNRISTCYKKKLEVLTAHLQGIRKIDVGMGMSRYDFYRPRGPYDSLLRFRDGLQLRLQQQVA